MEPNHNEVPLIAMEPDPVSNLVFRSFPNASEDKIINCGASIKDEIFNLGRHGVWLEPDEIEPELVLTDTYKSVDCCCDWSSNYYNVLCCGISDGNNDYLNSSMHNTDYEDARVAYQGMTGTGYADESGNAFDFGIDEEADVGLNVGADEFNMEWFELWSPSIEEAFYNSW